jgi:hypothetical protein
MSWAYGVDKDGREIGYSVKDICNAEGCEVEINRGISYRCGGVHNLRDDYGCGNFFCGNHMYFGSKDHLCEKCIETDPIDDEDDE